MPYLIELRPKTAKHNKNIIPSTTGPIIFFPMIPTRIFRVISASLYIDIMRLNLKKVGEITFAQNSVTSK